MVMMTSAADRPSSGCISTGMPRPLSDTVTEPSPCTVTWMSVQYPARASSTALSPTSNTIWVQANAVICITYVHARALTHGVQALQDLDVGRIIGFGCGGRAAGRARAGN